MNNDVDSSLPILIVGQGLAGSTLAWELHRRNMPFYVVDRPLGATASRVAAGLVNPMMGKVFRAGWRQAECMDYAAEFYPETEQALGGQWWQRAPIWRELETDDQVEIWKERQYDEVTSRWAGPMLPWPEGWTGKGKAGYTQGSYVLHAELFTNAVREWLISQSRFEEGEIFPEHIIEDEDCILWNGKRFSKIVWATGWEVSTYRGWEPLQGRPSMGTIIDVRLPGFDWTAGILHYGHWLVYYGDCWRLGATYAWTWSPDLAPDQMALQELLQGLSQHWKGDIEVIRYRSAIRPTIRRSQPVAGKIPHLTHHFIYSGLGSKGVTTSPWVAKKLADHLQNGTTLPDDLSPDHLWKTYRPRPQAL